MLVPVRRRSHTPIFVELDVVRARDARADGDLCADGRSAETPPSSPGDGNSSDGAAHAAATSVLVGLVAAFAV